MHLAPERGVPQQERDKAALDCLIDWDAARVFIEVVRHGSYRSAAERLELSIHSVRRRIDEFGIGAALLRVWQENHTFFSCVGHSIFGFPHPGSGRIQCAAHGRLAGGSFSIPQNSRGSRTNSSIHVNLKRYIR
jgi:hypothetical protein